MSRSCSPRFANPHTPDSTTAAGAQPVGTTAVGILNVTSDSFSDGGRFLDRSSAVAHGLRLHRAGAHVVDVGGESTRPGAQRVPEKVERDRVVPVVEALAARGVTVSVDTMRADTAAAAVRAGATYINDVSGGGADPEMFDVAAETGVRLIINHWHSMSDSSRPRPCDIVTEVLCDLDAMVSRALAAGVSPESVIVDPGLGFGKSSDDNWALLTHLPRLCALGYPVLIGASRKRFLGALLGEDGQDRPTVGRDTATAVISALAAHRGAWGVRVHDVSGTLDALRVAEKVRHAPRPPGPTRRSRASRVDHTDIGIAIRPD
ncbi:dihydropteroate synthase [Rhodococcus sp. NCIMB 12038]|uniref:dihydropteroate synthase n=1 Tax=Rhodococcus sp. NCIMB 12038 TaxID=933800 RepID=UPI000B3BEA7C|nr:dihydropteroate synthase [Rhodococcus sp. NCIMB 12038]OUS88676.1 dihydropteroate synthase [Rhodococcus sp. NCIMB 12038]